MGDEMRDQTGLVRRKGSVNYYLRVRVPGALREHYGKAEIWRSLGTANKADAIQKARLERLKLDQEFHQAHSVLAPAPVADLTELEIERLAALWHAHLLEEDEESRLEEPSDRAFEKRGETLDVVTTVTAYQLARGQVDGEALAFEMGDFVESHGIKLDPGSDTWRRLSLVFLKAYRRALDSMQARQRGEAVDTPQVEPLVIRGLPSSREGDTLEALLEYWTTQGEKRPRTLMEARKVVKDFIALHGAIPASRIEKTHVVALKDSLLGAGKAPATVLKNLNLLKAIFSVAVENSKLKANPAVGVVVKNSAVESDRKPFGNDDIRAIFASPVFSQGARPVGGAGDASFWFPLIGLFTGMREDEIGQLDAADVKEEGGGWYFHIIHDPAQGRFVKAKRSRRAPIHQELIRCGLLEYLGSVKKAGHTKLFPLLASAPGRQLTSSWSQWFGRYLRKVAKVTDPDKVFHSFRHTFKDAWRECMLPEDISDAITGHKNDSIGRRYGGKLYPLKPMLEAMGTFAYDGLDLSHLHRPALGLPA